jgi:D-arabinitol dehydrogenase (NADP+)
MKAVVYDAARSYAVKEIPTPQAADHEVRIKVDQVGVCGTDLHIHEGDFNAVFPLIPATSWSAWSTSRRRRHPVPGRRAGHRQSERVLRALRYCLSGRLILCANARVRQQLPGFFAEYVTVPENLVFSVDGLPKDTAVFTEPAACAMHGLETLRLRPGSSVLVFGAARPGCCSRS